MLKRTDAVLVICECGFLSNPEEEALLNSKEYQKKVADALCHGILDYLGEEDSNGAEQDETEQDKAEPEEAEQDKAEQAQNEISTNNSKDSSTSIGGEMNCKQES